MGLLVELLALTLISVISSLVNVTARPSGKAWLVLPDDKLWRQCTWST